MSTVIYSPEESALYADTAYFQNGTLASTNLIRTVLRHHEHKPSDIYGVASGRAAVTVVTEQSESSGVTEQIPLITLREDGAASITEDLCLHNPAVFYGTFLAVGTGATLAYAFNHTGYSPEQVMSAVRDLDPWTAGRIVKAYWKGNEMQIEEVG